MLTIKALPGLVKKFSEEYCLKKILQSRYTQVLSIATWVMSLLPGHFFNSSKFPVSVRNVFTSFLILLPMMHGYCGIFVNIESESVFN